MHHLLERQIRRYLGKSFHADSTLQSFLQIVDDYYHEIDKEKKLLQNALLVNNAELNELNERLRLEAVAFETREAILIADTDVNIIRVNQAFQDITGYSAEEVIGKNPRMMSSGRHDKKFYAELWRTLRSVGTWSGEILDKRKNGEIYPQWLTITAITNHAGTITQYVAIFSDLTIRKEAEEKIHILGFYDALTKLPNRRMFQDRLQHALATSSRNGRYGALLFLDLDQFKIINDTKGHAMGDLLLIDVAHRLSACVREGDSVARLGGDEFVVVLVDLSDSEEVAASQTESVSEKILIELAQPYLLEGYECLMTVSIGISLFLGHQTSAEELLQHTDVAMYQAKKTGRNTARFFDPQMQASITARASLERDLRKAIEGRQFQLYYQVQVDHLNHTLGAEALIRWIHPERGIVSPAQFIPLAEEIRLILPIGQWVLDTACAQLKVWQQKALTRDLGLSINVSAR